MDIRQKRGSIRIRSLPFFFALTPRGYLLALLAGVLLASGCGLFSTRPSRHLSYAEAAYMAAQKANAETLSPQSYQLARETLYRARASYRLKNFKLSRRLSIRARLLSEEAEFKSLHKESDQKENPAVDPEG